MSIVLTLPRGQIRQWQRAPVKVIGDFGEGHFGKEAGVETRFRQQQKPDWGPGDRRAVYSWESCWEGKETGITACCSKTVFGGFLDISPHFQSLSSTADKVDFLKCKLIKIPACLKILNDSSLFSRYSSNNFAWCLWRAKIWLLLPFFFFKPLKKIIFYF